MASQRWVSMGVVGLGLSLLSSASYGAQRAHNPFLIPVQMLGNDHYGPVKQATAQKLLLKQIIEQKISDLKQMNSIYLDTDQKLNVERDLVRQITKDLDNLAHLDPKMADEMQPEFRVASSRADKPLTEQEVKARQEAAEAYAKERAEQELADQQQLVAKKQHEADINRAVDKIGAVGAIVGQQMFVERHCPMIQPDQDVIESMIQQPNQPQIKMPGQWTAKEVEAGSAMLSMMETNTDLSRGFKAGSPMDVQWKCAIIANTLANTWHIYRYVQN